MNGENLGKFDVRNYFEKVERCNVQKVFVDTYLEDFLDMMDRAFCGSCLCGRVLPIGSTCFVYALLERATTVLTSLAIA